MIMNSNELAEEIDLTTVKKRSLVGVVSLVSRSFLIQVVAFASNLFLTIFLDPKTFGVFFLVSASINIFRYFSDIGLAAALIQKKENLTDEDLKTTFTIQQILVILLLLIIFSLSFLYKKIYGFDQSAIYLFYALAISFFLSSLKTIPSVLLERSLKFNKLIIPQILEILVYNLVAVVLAWRGFGISSFTFAVLAQAVVGLVAMYIISPWKIGFGFSAEPLKRLLKFGIPYQANTFVAAAKDDLMTIVLGKIIGTTGLGYLGWAKKWAEIPLRFFMDNVSKVVFPAFSRMQTEKEQLSRAVEKTIFFLSFLTFPILTGFSVLASDMVKVIPRYTKWEPALVALYLYCFNSAWASISTSMTNLLNAIGKIKITFKLMIMWLVLTWVFMPFLGIKFGYNGVAAASAIISLSSAVAIYYAGKFVKFNIVEYAVKPLVASLLMGLTIYFIKPLVINLQISIMIRIILGFFSYLLYCRLLLGSNLFKDIAKIRNEFKK